MIRIFTGWSNVGGSTVAFINLVNLFNKNKHEAILYGPHDWHMDRCKSEKMDIDEGTSIINNPKFIQDTLKPDDVVICHSIPLAFSNAGRGFLKKAVYSCHETDVYPLTNVQLESFDFVHYVSNFQKSWHNLPHIPSVVIPNIINNLSPMKKTMEHKKIGGVIGSIDPHKRTHISVLSALKDGCDKVLIFGAVTNPGYYEANLAKLVEDERVEYCGVVDDKSLMYSNLDTVYHSSPRETFNYIEHECAKLEIEYVHTGGIATTSQCMEEEQILSAWQDCLSLDAHNIQSS